MGDALLSLGRCEGAPGFCFSLLRQLRAAALRQTLQTCARCGGAYGVCEVFSRTLKRACAQTQTQSDPSRPFTPAVPTQTQQMV